MDVYFVWHSAALWVDMGGSTRMSVYVFVFYHSSAAHRRTQLHSDSRQWLDRGQWARASDSVECHPRVREGAEGNYSTHSCHVQVSVKPCGTGAVHLSVSTSSMLCTYLRIRKSTLNAHSTTMGTGVWVLQWPFCSDQSQSRMMVYVQLDDSERSYALESCRLHWDDWHFTWMLQVELLLWGLRDSWSDWLSSTTHLLQP